MASKADRSLLDRTRGVFAFGIGNRANYRTRRTTTAPRTLVRHSWGTYPVFSVEQCVEHGFFTLDRMVSCPCSMLMCSWLSRLGIRTIHRKETIHDDERND